MNFLKPLSAIVRLHSISMLWQISAHCYVAEARVSISLSSCATARAFCFCQRDRERERERERGRREGERDSVNFILDSELLALSVSWTDVTSREDDQIW